MFLKKKVFNGQRRNLTLTYGQAARLIIEQYSEVRKGNCSVEAFLALIKHWLDFAQMKEEDKGMNNASLELYRKLADLVIISCESSENLLRVELTC